MTYILVPRFVTFTYTYFASGLIVTSISSVPRFTTLSTHEFFSRFWVDLSGTVSSAPQLSYSVINI